MISEQVFAGLDAAVEALADGLAAALRAALEEREEASLLVSGGRTPRRVLPRLAAADLDWSRVIVGLTDERWVPPGHADGNETLVRETLLVGAAAAARFVGLWRDTAAPNAAVSERSAAMAALPVPYDVVFCGIGDDGHIASLFPDDPTWRGATGLLHPVAATANRGARMSLSAAALLNARRHCLCISGSKRRVYESIRARADSKLPAAMILNQDKVPVSVFLAP